jgi:hypothetical protein
MAKYSAGVAAARTVLWKIPADAEKDTDGIDIAGDSTGKDGAAKYVRGGWVSGMAGNRPRSRSVVAQSMAE